jgi:hypothetical protein
MEETIHELVTNQSSSPNRTGDEPQSQQLDMNALSDMVMSRIESTMDLKAFYENDQRLSSEIELLQKSNESQQITINSLNATLHYIIQNLNLSNPTEEVVNSDINSFNSLNGVGYTDETEKIVSDTEDEVDTSVNDDEVNTIINENELNENAAPTFPDSGRSVIINEVANEIREFSQMEDDEEGSNYAELENPPVD